MSAGVPNPQAAAMAGSGRVFPSSNGTPDLEAPAGDASPLPPMDSLPGALPSPGSNTSSSSNTAKEEAKAVMIEARDLAQLAVAPSGSGDPPIKPADIVDVKAQGEGEVQEGYADVTYMDIFKQFSLLGWVAFGGPAAHIGLFEKRLVDKLRWMSHAVYMELFALGSCLPGPTSTQVSFAIGIVTKGALGGLLSGALFQYPGAIIMTAVGVGAAEVLGDPELWLKSLTAGVSAVGVALVASAAKGLLIKLCATEVLAIVGTLSAAAAIYWDFPWLFPLVILAGGIITAIQNRKLDMSIKGEESHEGVKSHGVNMKVGALIIAIWLAILIVVLVLVRTLDYDHRVESTPLDWFEVFYRTGSIIYGGGQVVLPMLLNDLVKYNCDSSQSPPCKEDPTRSWMTAEQFYAGLGIVQAMPGPLFNFSAYLGAIIAWNAGQIFLLGTVLAWFGLFGPGVMLIFGVMPYWKKFRKWQIYRRALPGMNAAAVGLILSSVFKMTLDVYAISPFPSSSLCIGLFAFTAVDSLKIFEPFVVIGGILLGLIAWGAKMN